MNLTIIDDLKPDHFEFDNNYVYKEFNSRFLESFLDLASDHAFEMCYQPAAKMTSADRLCKLLSPQDIAAMESDQLAGEYEVDLLWYSLCDSDGNIPFLLLQGGIGSGKSTLVASMRRIVKRYNLDHKLDVQTINFNQYVSDLDSLAGDRPKLRAKILELITKRVTAALRNVIDLNNEPFWRFIFDNSLDFEPSKTDLLASRAIYALSDPERAKNEELLIRRSYLKTNSALWDASRYWDRELNRRIVLILDNVDPLHVDVQSELTLIARELAGASAIKIVLPVRPETKRFLATSQSFLRFRSLPIRTPGIPDILRRRNAYLITKTEEQIALRSNGESVGGNTSPALQRLRDQRDALDVILEILLSDSVVNQLRHLACDDVRLALRMAVCYFRSGWLDAGGVSNRVSAAADRHGSETALVPEHIFTQSVVTNNHKTLFLQTSFDNIINVWCDGSEVYPFCHFATLNMLQLAAMRTSWTFSELSRDLELIYAKAHPAFEGSIPTHLRRLLVKLVNARLLKTPVAHRISSIADHDEVSISSLGNYYRSDFSFSIEYFGFAKDSIRIAENDGSMHPFESAIGATRLVDRLRESAKAIEYLWMQEESLLNRLKNPIDRRSFREYVNTCAIGVEGRKRSFSFALSNSMHNFMIRKIADGPRSLGNAAHRTEFLEVAQVFDRLRVQTVSMIDDRGDA